MPGNIIVEERGHVLHLKLDNPERLNALDRDMFVALEQEFTHAGQDPNIRVILISATEGRGFCSGADVSGLKTGAEGDAEEQRKQGVPPFTARQAKIFKPTICAVNGICAGAGLHFVADSDIVIASESASFTDTHVNVGQVSALEPIGLMQRASLSTVLRMVILGKAERLDAQKALEQNLVSEVMPADKLMNRAWELAEIVCGVSPASVQRSLKAIYASLEMPLEEAYENGLDVLFKHREHPDALEGPRAFLEKRIANWTMDDPA